MSEYTPEMIARMKEASPINNEKAMELAEEFGLSVHSVRTKARLTEGVVYTPKSRTRKDGAPVESKADIVQDIAELVGSDAESFESLQNATRVVLVKLREALQ